MDQVYDTTAIILRLVLQELLDLLCDLVGTERLALNLGVGEEVVTCVLTLQQTSELPEIHLGNQDGLVAREDLVEPVRQRPDMTEMDPPDLLFIHIRALGRICDRPISRTPAEDQ